MRTSIETDGVNIRYRSATGLRPFSTNFTLHEDEGFFDRLMLEYTFEIRYHNPDILSEYVEHVSGRSGSLPWNFLSIDQLSNSYKPKVRTAAATEVSGGDWIINASGTLSNTRQPNGGVATLALTLHVNPTTFLANQPEDMLSDLSSLQPEDAFFANPVLLAAARARSCDGNANILLGHVRRGGRSFCRREEWNAGVIEAVITKLDHFLRQQLVPSETNGLPDVGVSLRPATVSQAEVYWEFESEDAISDVLTIGDRLSLAAGQVSVRRHFPEANYAATGHAENGASVTIDLTRFSGRTQLLIYAKSDRVVRIEVKYLKQLRQTVARSARGTQSIENILNLTRHHALQLVATVRRAIMEVTPNLHERADLVLFLRLVSAAAAGNEDVEQGVLTRLVNVRALSETDAEGVCPEPVCVRLVRSGVLQRVRVRHGGPRRYALTPTYAALVESLHDARPCHRELRAERGERRLS